MSHTIIIQSWSKSELEWEHEVEAPTQRGARSKATRWIHRNICGSDYSRVGKYAPLGTGRERWILMPVRAITGFGRRGHVISHPKPIKVGLCAACGGWHEEAEGR